MTVDEEAAVASAKKTYATAFEMADAEASIEPGPAQTRTHFRDSYVSKMDDAGVITADFIKVELLICHKHVSFKSIKVRPDAKRQTKRSERLAVHYETAKRLEDMKQAAQGCSGHETKATKILAHPPVRSQRRAVPRRRPTIVGPKRPVVDVGRRADSSGRREEPVFSPATSPVGGTAIARPSAPIQAHVPPARARMAYGRGRKTAMQAAALPTAPVSPSRVQARKTTEDTDVPTKDG